MRSPKKAGLTLLELVLVVAILAAIAGAAVSVTDQVDSQSRYDTTRSRGQAIHDAIVGPGGTSNGSPLIQGFVADMGRLPASLSELVEPATGGVALPGFNVDNPQDLGLAADANGHLIFPNVGCGWRGPYVAADQENLAAIDGPAPRPVFRDGWGNTLATETPTTPDLNFGWTLATPAYLAATSFPPFSLDNWLLKSLGSDNKDDTLTPPPSWDAADFPVTIAPADYLVNVSAWSITVNVSAGTTLGLSPELRIYFPVISPTTTAPAGEPSFTFVHSTGPTSGTPPALTFSGFQYPSGAAAFVPIGVRSIAIVTVNGGSSVLVGNYSPSQPVPVVIAPRTALAPISVNWAGN